MADTATQATRLLFLHAQTGLHPGSGTALGAVDLPVQRERHTQWPTIPGSALKGILRDLCREEAKGHYSDERGDDNTVVRSRRRIANETDADLLAAFGPGRIEGDADAFAGALSVTDARLLAFPVRSLKGVFAWVTCPAVLERLNRDLKMVGEAVPAVAVPVVEKEHAACADGSPLLLDDKLVLEEFEFQRKADAAAATWIAARAVEDKATQDRLRGHFAVLHDDDFTHFARHATEIVARVGLDYDKKTVKDGALFYQEFLPAETIFYAVVFATESRHRGKAATAAEIMSYLAKRLERKSLLQIGGDETTGKGLCRACLRDGKEGERG